jgi:hypothetical protein
MKQKLYRISFSDKEDGHKYVFRTENKSLFNEIYEYVINEVKKEKEKRLSEEVKNKEK